MFCGLKERTKFRQEKKGKQKTSHRGQKWVGRDERVS